MYLTVDGLVCAIQQVLVESMADVSVPMMGHVCVSLQELALSSERAALTTRSTSTGAAPGSSPHHASSVSKKKSATALCVSTQV